MAGTLQALFRRVERRWSRLRRRAHNRDELRRIRASRNDVARAIGDAIADVLADEFDTAEKHVFSRIDALRRDLLRQTDRQVTLTDYGAGNPSQEYATDESAVGVVVKRTVAGICESGGLSPLWNRVLFQLIRKTSRRRGLELGCSLGLSASYQGSALAMNDAAGRLLTLDGAAPLAQIARENWKTLGIDNVEVLVGRFQDTLPRVYEQHAPFDYAFIDGHHDEEATLEYFEQLLEHTTNGAILVFDDILWYEGMKRAWRRIQQNPRVSLAVDLGVLGVVVTSDVSVPKAERYSFDLTEH